MRAALIENGIVINAVETESLDFPGVLLVASDTALIGDMWDGSSFARPGTSAASTVVAVDMRQAELLMHRTAGMNGGTMLEDVEALIAQADPETKIEWKRAKELRRDHPMVETVRVIRGMTQEDMDAFFSAAAAIGPAA